MAMRCRFAIVQAPSVLGLKPTGVERLPEAMLAHGLRTRLHARDAARLVPPPYDASRDPETGTLNAVAIARWTPTLADAIDEALTQGEFPIVLGGDCSILLGAMLALKRRGRYGLLFLDGHADFYQPEVNPNGEAASMELAFATGAGPRLLTDIEGKGPLVRAGDVAAVGFRDGEEQARFGSQRLPREMLALDLRAVRQLGIEDAAARAVAHVTGPSLDGFFIHVDADCLADEIMPAVDYRLPDGLSWREATTLLGAAMASGRPVGLELTIYNPALDVDGTAGRALADLLVSVLAPHGDGRQWPPNT